MNLQIEPLQNSNIIRLTGDLDIYAVEEAREGLLDHLVQRASLELDLGGIETCDATGLQLLLSARRSATASGKSFLILNRTSAIEQCGELLGVDPDNLFPPAA